MRVSVLVFVLLLQTMITSAQAKKFLIPYRAGDKWGFCDTLGKVIIQAKYDFTDFCLHGDYPDTEVGKILSTKGYGLISFTGKEVVPALYNDAYPLGDHYVAEKNLKFGLYNPSGKLVIPVTYDAITLSYDSNDEFRLVLNEKEGVYFAKTNQLIPAVYDVILGDFYSFQVDNEKWLYARKGDKKFLINRQTGKMVPYQGDEDLEDYGSLEKAPPEIDEMMPVSTEVQDMKTIKTALDADTVMPYENFSNHFDVLTTKLYIVKKKRKTGLAYANTSTVASPVYDSITYVMNIFNKKYLSKKSNFLVAAKKGNYFGLINEAAEEILPFQYDLVTWLERYAYAFLLVANNKKGVFLPATFYPVIPPKYDDIKYHTAHYVSDNWSFAIFQVVKDGKTGFVGENGIEYFKD
jgi:hypothetical protein